MSQEQTVLKMLEKAGSNGVHNYKFPEARILCYTKRISELRKEGHNIITERVKLPNGRSTNVHKYILIKEKKPLWQKLLKK